MTTRGPPPASAPVDLEHAVHPKYEERAEKSPSAVSLGLECLHLVLHVLKMGRRPTEQKKTTNALLLLTVLNHAAWSTMHVAARYLQVYARPLTFDGQGVLSSSKGFAALFLFVTGIAQTWVENFRLDICMGSNGDAIDDCSSSENSKSNIDGDVERNGALHSERSLPQTNVYASGDDLNRGSAHASQEMGEKNSHVDEKVLRLQASVPSSSVKRNENSSKIIYTLLFAFVTTTRASSNIASARYTYPYNITLIASLTPVIIAMFDRFFLSSPFPPLLWPTIFLSGFGGFLIATSQSLKIYQSSERETISATDNLIGCSLQLLSAIFSAFARILMKQTEDILTSTHIVQINNISNCIFPFLYTVIYNPGSWTSFRYLLVNPKSLLAWCTISMGVYSFASMLQIMLVRRLGPGFYSSWVAVRVIGSTLLSTIILGEGANSFLEWTGIGIMIGTISIYLVQTRKWMDIGKERKRVDGASAAAVAEVEAEEAPTLSERSSLLAGGA